MNYYDLLLENPSAFPFSFNYGQKEYTGFPERDFEIISKDTYKEKKHHTTDITFKKDETLNIKVKCSFYPEFGASEWTVWFKNPSSNNSLILENPKTVLKFKGDRPVLKGILGDHTNFYRPYSIDLDASPVHYESNSGRATHVYFPYFNLEYGNVGAFLAIGWAGTWTADFRAQNGETVYTANSVNNLKTYLKPGEEIRTALFLHLPYNKRDENYATNFWRSFFIECNMPKLNKDGDDVKPFSTCCLASDTGIRNSDGSVTENHKSWRPSLEKMIAEDVKVDARWLDAGWYQAPDLGSADSCVEGHDWGDTIGTWQLDPKKWPDKTFLESTDFAREYGMKTIMWFEPERVTQVDHLVKNFGYKKEWAIERKGQRHISNNLGNKDCYNWTVSRILKTLRDNKVEIYREDNNSDQAGLWKHLDSKDGENRLGITECKMINAHYNMWDEILNCTLSYGGCGFSDSCASGGGRNDLESLRRGIPLLRSDADRESTGLRLSMTSSFNKWVPFCGANTKEKKYQLDSTGNSDVYIWRASYLPVLNVDSQFVYDKDQNFDILRFGLKEWKKVNPYLLKEFYVLTPWHTKDEVTGFTSFCYFDKENKKGLVLAFRQEQCMEENLNITLPFAKDFSEFIFTDEDSKETCKISSRELKDNGFDIHFDNPRTAKLFWIEVM